ncbi:CoA transferase [Microbispora sp. NPDC049125]|uniref:CoA transferase n=1 Tax=Microbispora sp. NPDC049125 TaxID=3154929 RepID=UPI003464F8E0
MIEGLIEDLGANAGVVLPEVHVTGGDPVLRSGFRIGTAAAASVGAATAAVAALAHRHRRDPARRTSASEPSPYVTVDVRHAAIAFQSERHFRIDGRPMELWAELSGDYRTRDGWVRIHCNFDHHRDAALRGLGLRPGATRADLARGCESRTAMEIEEVVTAEGGCAAALRSRDEWLAHPQARAIAGLPLVGLSPLPGPYGAASAVTGHDDRLPAGGERIRSGDAGAGRPLSGVRVLDLTRVIAGPVAARTLAAHGAEVLRVGAAHVPEVPGLVAETAFGKRSCHIDLRSEPDRLRELVRQADVVIQAYRPGSLSARGFGAGELAALRPGIVCVDVSAYGSRGPWAERRGFDSLVQTVCGIAHEAGDGSRPGALPAQALDHATGYLAAFGAVAALLRRTAEGGSWQVEVSLARTAAWLDGLGRVDGAAAGKPPAGDLPAGGLLPGDLLATMPSAFGTLTYVTPPGHIDGAPPYWAGPPPRRGEHAAAWTTRRAAGPAPVN